ncbi:MAG TPA: LysR substrate-binding domain-containing protein [Steroidobacteraceae bacterium]|nr:LysR substrate-binding domain-containing protein [Steroidobacteraceae bacterium]
MQPLEGFYYFTQVVDHAGFAKAARALDIPKSRLSRHVASLETRLGVRLVNRSTRRFVVTDVGHEVYRHATAMLAEADAALEVVEFARAKPCGTIRASCPVALAQSALAPILPAFLEAYPAIRLELSVSNRRVDVLAESFDVALRVRTRPTGEDGLVMRTFREVDEFLVASPGYLKGAVPLAEPAELEHHTTLDYGGEFDRRPWELSGPQGESVSVEHRPRIVCHDFVVLRAAVLAGLGVARLPESVVRQDLESGALVRVLPAWRSPQGIVHVVFPTRRGMLPAVRALIDFLAERLPATL